MTAGTFLHRYDGLASLKSYQAREKALERASLAKIDAMIARAELRPGEHVLEIGCGWGECSIRMATKVARLRVTRIHIPPTPPYISLHLPSCPYISPLLLAGGRAARDGNHGLRRAARRGTSARRRRRAW